MYKEYNPVIKPSNYSLNDMLMKIRIERSYLRDIEHFNTRFTKKNEILSKINFDCPIFFYYLCEQIFGDNIKEVLVGSEYDFGLWKLAWQAIAIEHFKEYPKIIFRIYTKYKDKIIIPIPNNVIINSLNI